ncbi:embigin [Halichoeres trimaculatus]|uniref:embigin n=1 Tax=Halichoeres trimaculatus TaxID=147232 RepID=UPI003D9E5E6C
MGCRVIPELRHFCSGGVDGRERRELHDAASRESKERSSERPARREDTGRITMSAVWKQLPFHILLLLISCRHIYTKTTGPTSPPLDPISPLPTIERSYVLKGKNHTERVELLDPVNLVLTCTWAGGENKALNITGYWKKDENEVENSRVTVQLENRQYNLNRSFSIVGEKNLGNYSCVFGNEAEIKFVLAAPQIGEVRDKPIVSYVGDSVVITCKMEENKPKPKTWNWFKANGTGKEQIVTSEEHHKYGIKNEEGKAKLLIHNLTEDDSGSYYCGAVYAIGTTMGRVELKVITFYEPLKPFIAILVEVVILVAAILLYEKTQSKKDYTAAGNGASDQTNTQSPGENNGSEESSSMRQRKV